MRLVGQVVKALVHRPWYAATIIMTMAVGSALLTSVLAIVDGVLFKPLGYPNARQLVSITVSSSRSSLRPSVDHQHLAAWAQAAPGVASTGFYRGPIQSPTSATAQAIVQPNIFDVLGVRPAIGGFTSADFEGPRSVVSWIEPRIVTDEIFSLSSAAIRVRSSAL